MLRLTKENKVILHRALNFAIRDRLLFKEEWYKATGPYAEGLRGGCDEAVEEFRALRDLLGEMDGW